MALKPLHDSLSAILRTIPNDGTFHQNASVERCKEKGNNGAWSFYLSSATDRLPISIQIMIINKYYKIDGIGEVWAKLLIDRDYHVGKNTYMIPVGPLRRLIFTNPWSLPTLLHSSTPRGL
jgi:hypothetical protein